MQKHLGLPPSVFYAVFSIVGGGFLPNICVSTHTCPLLRPFSTYAVSEICGQVHTAETDKNRASFFVLCPDRHIYFALKRRGKIPPLLSRCEEQNDKRHHANPRQNQTNTLLRFRIHRYVIAISAGRAFAILHQSFTFTAMELRRFLFRFFPFRFRLRLRRLLFLQRFFHLRNHLLF